MDEKSEDPVMEKVRKLIADSGMSRQEIGEKMGYGQEVARQAMSQFLKGGNPRIDRLRKFAKAMNVALSTLVRE